MTLRDQQEFKVRKLTRAIDALSDLSADFHLTAGVAETLRNLRHNRAAIRRDIANGSRSCGECGNPMSRFETVDDRLDDWTRGRLARLGESSYHACDNEHCEDHGRMVFE